MGLLAACLAALASPVRARESPNIVLILADDMGWNGSSALMDPDEPASKSDFHQSPNLEALAAAGMRLLRATRRLQQVLAETPSQSE